MVTRRNLLKIGGAVTTLPWLLSPAPTLAQEPSRHRLTAGSAILDMNGRPAKVFRLTNSAGASGLELAAGERFRVDLANQTGVDTIIHWHGQLPLWTQDGFPWPQTPLLRPNAVQPYGYKPIPGTYWMHSHDGVQEQSLLTGPLIIHSAGDMRADRQDVVMMLHDFSFTPPDQLLEKLKGKSTQAVHSMTHQMENAASPHATAAPDGVDRGAGVSMPPMADMKMDLNDFDYDAFLANDLLISVRI